jgi:arsenate reductase
MAEGLLNTFHGDEYEAYSAGIEIAKINPYAIKVMAEIGIDISKNRSKRIKEFSGKRFDYVVTVCDDAKEACPFFPGKKILHKSFKDPSKIKGIENDILDEVRRIRDEIKEWIKKTFEPK